MRRLWYRWFRWVSSLQHRLDRRLTPAGRLVLATLGAAAVVGLDTNRTLGAQVFALLGSLIVLSALASARFRVRLTARRILPRFATVGCPVTYRVVLRNETDARQGGLVLLDDLADPRPSFDEFASAREPGEERRNWFDRSVGYPRWMWLVARNRGAVTPRRQVPPVSPGDEVELGLEITPTRRGRLRFASVTIARPDPLGLVQAVRRLPLPQSLVVLPRRYPVPDIGLPGARKYQPGGVALASSVGDSEEFFALRDYRPGDPLRRIHWKSWARTGEPVVKEYLDEFFVRHALVLDTFGAAAGDLAFEEAVSVAASIAVSVDTQESLLDLMFVGAQAYCFTAGRGLGHTDRMLEVLASVGVCHDRPFRALQDAVLGRLDALSGCVCVLLAWDEPRREFIRRLQAVGPPTRVFVVTAPDVPVTGLPADVRLLVAGRIREGLARA
ncbi:MAG: hypothetical protein A3I17_02960 [Candidatus Rokubacteria bacterium RIFCSPLOWO2_02_FULL_72_37]|nr:MAG: hypothetical protein A3I17_02960 [Candidatus Rokubacteria bacterium RIFCSPLOWO2_02_FULL_72_37]